MKTTLFSMSRILSTFLICLFIMGETKVKGQDMDRSAIQELSAELDSIIPFFSVDMDSAYIWLKDMHKRASELEYDYGIGETNRLMGFVNWNKGDLGEAIKMYSIAQQRLKQSIHDSSLDDKELLDYQKSFWNASASLIDLYSSYSFANQDSALHYINELDESNILETDTAKQAQFLQSKSIAYEEMGRYKDAIENGLSLLAMSISNPTSQAEFHLNACMMISRSYDELEEVSNARKYIQKGLEIGQKGGLGYRHLSPLRNNYAVFLMEHAESPELGGDGKNKNESLLVFADSLIRENLKDENLSALYKALYTNTLAESTFYQNKFKEALKLHGQAADVFKENGYIQQYGTIILNMALCEVELGNYDKAIKLGQEGLKIMEDNDVVYFEKFAHEVLFRAYKDKGSYKQSLAHHEDFVYLKDSITNEEKLVQIADLEANHELSQKEKELALEKGQAELLQSRSEAKSKVIWIIGIAASLLLLSMVLLWRALSKNREANAVLSKQSETIRENLKEKEALLREVHHRVKNNLQVVSGMLQLQADKVDDPRVEAVMQEGQDRIKSMAMIHQKFYEGERLRDISFKDYLQELTDEIADSYGFSKDAIDLTIDKDAERFDIDTSIPLGIIVNELISNAYKHAFENSGDAQVDIQLKKVDEHKNSLTVKDTGVGLPEDFDLSKAQSMGLKLVRILVRQMQGSLEYFNDKGANFVITFPA